VVSIHFEIASASDFHVKQSVFSKEREHVIEEMDACGNTRLPLAIQSQLHRDIGLFRFAGNFCSTFLVQEGHLN
jgi:hypothetical protein